MYTSFSSPQFVLLRFGSSRPYLYNLDPLHSSTTRKSISSVDSGETIPLENRLSTDPLISLGHPQTSPAQGPGYSHFRSTPGFRQTLNVRKVDLQIVT